ncbi:MAG: hypothetical protein U1G07_25940 [Verrucomicrobiota bacterium]
MRDLTLPETGYLACLLLLSLVLPIMLSGRMPPELALQRSCARSVWVGQASLAAVGIAIVAAGSATLWVAVLGGLTWGTCAGMLRRQLRRAVPG